MESSPPATQTDRIVVVTRNNCNSCELVLEEVLLALRPYELAPVIFNLDHQLPVPVLYQTVITPAVFIDRCLWSYGRFEVPRLERELQLLFQYGFKKNRDPQILLKGEE